MPADWISIANTVLDGQFTLGGFGMTPLSSGAVKLGTLTVGSVPDPSHVSIEMTSGMLGNDARSALKDCGGIEPEQ